MCKFIHFIMAAKKKTTPKRKPAKKKPTSKKASSKSEASKKGWITRRRNAGKKAKK